jgi:hypothetical protein
MHEERSFDRYDVVDDRLAMAGSLTCWSHARLGLVRATSLEVPWLWDPQPQNETGYSFSLKHLLNIIYLLENFDNVGTAKFSGVNTKERT